MKAKWLLYPAMFGIDGFDERKRGQRSRGSRSASERKRGTSLRWQRAGFLGAAILGLVSPSRPLAGQQPLVAQRPRTDTDVPALRQMAAEFSARFESERAEAIKWAGGGPLRRELPNGRVFELMGVRDGRPYFYATDNEDAADTVSTDELWSGGSTNLNLDGTGVRLHIWDAGGVLTTHREFGSRVTQQDAPTTTHFHATHVAGTMVASGVDAAAHGMASNATLDAYEWTNDTTEIANAATASARVSNHSYGIPAGWVPDYWRGCLLWAGNTAVSLAEDSRFGLYTQDEQDWDRIAFNAPRYLMVVAAGNDRNDFPPAAGGHYHLAAIPGTCANNTCGLNACNPNGCLPTFPACAGTCQGGSNPGGRCCTNDDCQVFGANDAHGADGNNGTGYDSISSHGVAKNVLTVGAVGDIVGGYSNSAGVQMTAFSSWGPTDDGRIKPDIVANGLGVYSTDNGNNWAYATHDGTSMASPNVSGSLGLLIQHYRATHGVGVDMRSATLKALVIHTADEAGASNGPDYQHGWGLFNAKSAAALITRDVEAGYDYTIEEYSLWSGGSLTLRFKVSAATPQPPIKATICWTDPPGAAQGINALDPPGPNLINDLDLRVSGPTTNLPWRLNPANPAAAATRGDNSRDNVEVVQIDAPSSGDYVVSVTHKGTLYRGQSQPFSMILSGFDKKGTTLEFKPRLSGCDYRFCPNKIALMRPLPGEAPRQIVLDAWASGWSPHRLSGFQWTLNSSTLLNQQSQSTLTPVGWPNNPSLGASIDTSNPYYVFRGLADYRGINTQQPDYMYFSVVDRPAAVPDPGVPQYVGSLVVDTSQVYNPATFSVGPFGTYADGTFMLDENGAVMVFADVIPAEITIVDNNASCYGAEEITPGAEVTFDNSALSNSPNPAYTCSGSGNDGTLWYKFTATSTSARVETCGSTALDSTLAVYSGSCNALQQIGCSSSAACGALADACVTGLVPGGTYYVQVSARTSASRGVYRLGVAGQCDTIPKGACCQGLGQFCDDVSQAQCTFIGGVFQGVGTSCLGDLDGNLRDDACPLGMGTMAPHPSPDGFPKTRFVSFVVPPPPTGTAGETALRVRFVALHHVDPPYTGGTSTPFALFENQAMWVGPPTQYVESVFSGTPFYASTLQCSPYYQDWSTVGLLHVFGEAIVPSSTYNVENLAASCAGNEASCTAVSPALEVKTARWGDVETPYQDPLAPLVTQPDTSDISALVNKFKSALGAPIKARALLAGSTTRGTFTHDDIAADVGFTHISVCVDAFKGLPYPYRPGKCTGDPAKACISDTDCTNAPNPTTGPCVLCL